MTKKSKQAWSARGRGADIWAQELANIVKTEGINKHLLVGGCCRTGTTHIAALNRYMKPPDVGTQEIISIGH